MHQYLPRPHGCIRIALTINNHKVNAEKLSSYFATYGDESVDLQELAKLAKFLSLKEPIAVPSSHQQLIREHGRL